MPKVLLFIISLLAVDASAQYSFRYRCPNGVAVLPVSCLQGIKVKDVSRRLNEKERHQISSLFVKSYVVTLTKYHQDYLLNPAAPIYQLFKWNFPEVEKREGEGGIFPGEVYNFIKSMPGYRIDVERELRGMSKKQRRRLAAQARPNNN